MEVEHVMHTNVEIPDTKKIAEIEAQFARLRLQQAAQEQHSLAIQLPTFSAEVQAKAQA